jgi:EAL domain-containing protein (putative c-di-GMP-specific phosphodiesterase class I)
MNIQMQISGLAIMSLLLFFFLRQKRVGLYSEHIFLQTLVVTMISVVLDMCSVIAIHNMDILNPFILNVACKSYLVSIVWVGGMALIYVVADLISEKRYLVVGRILYVILILESVCLYLLPIYYHTANNQIYTYGIGVVMTYVFALLYIIIAFVCLFVFSSKMHSHRKFAFLAWISLWFIAAVIQFLHNEWLLVGFSCSLGMLIMFVALENPESNMDRTFDCFHSNALDKYLQQCYDRDISVSILMISMASMVNVSHDAEAINDNIIQLVHFLQKDKKIKVFKSMEEEILAVFPDMSEMTTTYQAVQDQFYADQFYDGRKPNSVAPRSLFPKTLFVLIPDSLIVKNKEDIFRLIQHIKVENREITDSQVCYVNQNSLKQMREQERVKQGIMDALIDDRVEVFFQPIYSFEARAFVSAEALVRIRGKDGKIISPGIFIPVAEESGLIGALGERVFEKTCQFLQDSKITKLGVHYIEVNLSVIQCEQRDLAERYIRIMKNYHVDPCHINLEITETGSVQTKKILIANMKKLIEYGVTFSLDDFGNGQSNLDYVIDMPVSIMKLDMNMTRNYFKSVKAERVMCAAIEMAHDIELKVVAEGVETEGQLNEMDRLKIDYIQGYYFSKPLPVDEYVQFMELHAVNRQSVC